MGDLILGILLLAFIFYAGFVVGGMDCKDQLEAFARDNKILREENDFLKWMYVDRNGADKED